jgi:integrase
MSATLVGTLKNLRPADCDPESLVFATPGGVPLNPKNLYNRQLAPCCDRIGLPRVSWHSFRHTHATLLHASGESLTPIWRPRSLCTPTSFPTRRGAL